MTRQKWSGSARAMLLFTLLFALFAWRDVSAQNVTGSIRGRVINESGAPVVAATITARNPASGATRTALTNADGTYVLAGLQPGTYEISVEMIGYSAPPRSVRVLIGQSLNMDLSLQPQAIELAGVTAVGTRTTETRTSEIATNITEEQLESLPQADRNFLNFAGLAPGITVSRDELNKNITAGGLPATKINVFVDGASFKNDVLEGGVHGQDASRGNPFPQIALQEFRVITQNFKAEYQRAASAVITATTKSGTNEFKVDGFVLGQNKGLVERDPGAELICQQRQSQVPPQACDPKPEYERLQLGVGVGGPIKRDKAHYFLAFEGNYQNRESIVAIGRASEFSNTVLPATGQTAGSYAGAFEQPFRSSLGVAKISFIPGANQTLDLSWNGRFESDKRSFGGQTSFESAENVAIKYNVLTLQHTMTRGSWLNQAHISAQRSTWNPQVINEDLDIGMEYMGVVRIGARSTEQNFVQDRIALRNDLSRLNVTWNGNHVFKGGVNLDFLNYQVEKLQDGNPTFFFDVNASLDDPAFARWGSGNPGMDANNLQFGAYIQDDWDVTERLQLNLGVRWDAETNMFNNDWVTPDSIRTQLGPIVTAAGYDPSNYFTRGNEDRPMFLGAFQPRVGFSFDVTGSGRTVLHGGWGLYYDREIWNHLIDESFRLTWVVRAFDFTSTGQAGRIPWQDSYMSRAGLQGLVDASTTGVQPGITSEVWLLKNDSKPPKSNQWNVGLRQTVGPVVVGGAYRGVRGENLTSWYCLRAHSVHGYCEGSQELGSRYKVLISTDEGESKYDAFDITLDKPFSEASKWGMTLAYTNASAQRKGWDFFSWDFGDNPAEWEFVDAPVEEHHVSASAMVALPFDIRASTIAQWGSGVPFSLKDEINGWGPARVQVDWYSQDPPDFRQVDFRLEKRVSLAQGNVGVIVELLNAFNHDNFRGYEELYRFDNGSTNASFGKPQTWTADQGRRFQLGLNFGIN
ncbi:MAG TPA: carboxypeptidase regulatory-like domain-containing protein [Longimicrobiales bacterium]|nr:carboxypeptidase regulatory-like domain-containing protein [Longimicrobiales bacterium]